jgi:hypothetical protein
MGKSHPRWQPRHADVLAWHVLHPAAPLRECSQATGYATKYLSRIICSPDFRARLAEVRAKRERLATARYVELVALLAVREKRQRQRSAGALPRVLCAKTVEGTRHTGRKKEPDGREFRQQEERDMRACDWKHLRAAAAKLAEAHAILARLADFELDYLQHMPRDWRTTPAGKAMEDRAYNLNDAASSAGKVMARLAEVQGAEASRQTGSGENLTEACIQAGKIHSAA